MGKVYILIDIYYLLYSQCGMWVWLTAGGCFMKRIILDWDESEDDTIYSEEYREHLLEDGELSPEEEAFMRGYEEAM